MPHATDRTAPRNAGIAMILLLILGALSADAQTAPPTNQGREFWVVFQKNFRDYIIDSETMQTRPAHPLTLELEISSAKPAKGYVEIPSLGFRREFMVKPGTMLRIPIDTAAQLRGSERIEKLGVHVVASAPVTVTGLNRRYQSTDTYLALPVDALGTVYRAVGFSWLQDDLLSQLAVVATEDATEVRITPSMPTHSGRSEPFIVMLNRGDVYQVIPKFDPNTKSDLTGTLVTATKPVALFSGHNCAYVPTKMEKACNLLVEQLTPTSAWGTNHVVVPLADRARSIYRVVASAENTDLRVHGTIVATLQAGEFYQGETDASEALYLVASHPVMVTQFSTGYDDQTWMTIPVKRNYRDAAPKPPVVEQELAVETPVEVPAQREGAIEEQTEKAPPSREITLQIEQIGVGDPMMLLIPTTAAYLSEYRVHTPTSGSWHHFINVIAPLDAVATFRIDDRDVDVDGTKLASLFRPVGTSGWYAAQIEIADGLHRVSASAPIGVYQYGFGFGENAYDAYGNSAGGSTAKRE